MGIEFFSLGNRPNNRLLRLFYSQIAATRTILSVRAQIWHLHDPELLPIAAILILLRRKVIWDAHEDYYLQFKLYSQYRTYLPKIFRKFLSFLTLSILNFVDNNAAGVVTATKTIKNSYKNINCVVIGNEARVEEFEKANPSFSSNKVLFLGSTTEAHCFQQTVDAILDLENLQLIVAGTAVDSQSISDSKKLLGNRITFFGWANRSELLDLVSESVMGIVTYQDLPTYNEAEPTKLFEFLMSGLPIVATPVKPSKHYLELSGGGVISKGFMAKDLREAIQKLLVSEKAWSKMSKDGKVWAKENASWDKSEAQLFSFYSKLV
jgi:glycosyltransferase involved in cell wall biosynthesis